MGVFDRFKKPTETQEMRAVQNYFKLMTAYAPAFSTYQGGIYEMSLTRAAIHAFATHCGKLEPKMTGSAKRYLEPILKFMPNETMDTYTFLYKLATILKVENTAFILPIFDERMRIVGFYPQSSIGTEVRSIDGVQYLFYPAPTQMGQNDVIEFKYVGVMRNHFYKQRIYGDSNVAFDSTMNMIYTQEQAIINGVKNSAIIRFLAKLANVLKPADITAERVRFAADNLGVENNGGVMLFDQKYDTVQQIESAQMLVDDKQTQIIKNNVYEYFGTNEDILMNKFDEETWDAFYEGAIEPFAIQLSLVLCNMIYTDREKATENMLIMSSNRLQYASNKTKIQFVTTLFDRGFLTHNDGRDVFNMAKTENGDILYIRREYVEVSKLGDVVLDKEAPLAPPSEFEDDKEDTEDDNNG
jgi:hypothetical protein